MRQEGGRLQAAFPGEWEDLPLPVPMGRHSARGAASLTIPPVPLLIGWSLG